MALNWPSALPMPQVNSLNVAGPDYAANIDVLSGPTRRRLAQLNAPAGYEFEVWLSADQAQQFEMWYAEVVALHDGEWFAPWIEAGAAVVAFVNEYQQAPLGTGWRVSGVVTLPHSEVS